jgi:tellurite methyltransferase
MNDVDRTDWDERHRGRLDTGAPEPFVLEMMPLIARGLALDVAAGRGRHAIALARAGFRVVAVDYSKSAMETLAAVARTEHLPVSPVVADIDDVLLRARTVDAIINVNFLERRLVPALKQALKKGGVILFDTFLEDQAAIGHPRNPEFLLRHYELRDLLDGLELVRYREGLTVYSDDTRAWRASALAIRRN